MPFFIPEQLVKLEYTQVGEASEIEREYAEQIDFAFFVVNYGYSKEAYLQLTPTEKAFIRKAHENKQVLETTLLRDAVLNAIGNGLRKKGSRFNELWRKVSSPIDVKEAEAGLAVVLEMEATEGKGWVDKIYLENGLRPPIREEAR